MYPTHASTVQGFPSLQVELPDMHPFFASHTGGVHKSAVILLGHELKMFWHVYLVSPGLKVQPSTVHKLLSLQSTEKATTQAPVVTLHVWGLHRSELSQSLGVKEHVALPATPTQASSVQGLLSVQVTVVPEHTPVVLLQEWGLQGSVVAQGFGVYTQLAVPPLAVHVSVVHALLSSQTTGVAKQFPVLVSHEVGLQGSVLLQSLGVNEQFAAPLATTHLSMVQGFKSLHCTALSLQEPVV